MTTTQEIAHDIGMTHGMHMTRGTKTLVAFRAIRAVHAAMVHLLLGMLVGVYMTLSTTMAVVVIVSTGVHAHLTRTGAIDRLAVTRVLWKGKVTDHIDHIAVTRVLHRDSRVLRRAVVVTRVLRLGKVIDHVAVTRVLQRDHGLQAAVVVTRVLPPGKVIDHVTVTRVLQRDCHGLRRPIVVDRILWRDTPLPMVAPIPPQPMIDLVAGNMNTHLRVTRRDARWTVPVHLHHMHCMEVNHDQSLCGL